MAESRVRTISRRSGDRLMTRFLLLAAGALALGGCSAADDDQVVGHGVEGGLEGGLKVFGQAVPDILVQRYRDHRHGVEARVQRVGRKGVEALGVVV